MSREVERVGRAERRRRAANRESVPVSEAGAPSSSKAAAPRAWAILTGLVPVAVAFFVFRETLGYGFIWDDPLVLDQLRAMHGLRDLFLPPDIVPRFYYRPLTFGTLLLDLIRGGGSPAAFHTSVVLWHCAVTGLVFLLARTLLGASHVVEASAAALLFAVHPIHVESVAWIAGRSDVIATAFVILALLLASRTERAWTAWVAGATLFCGLLAKEVAVAVLVLAPARDLLAERRLHWRRYVPLAIAIGLYLPMRRAFLGAFGGGLPVDATTPEILRDLLAAVGWYVAKAVLPIGLNAYVPEVPGGPGYLGLGLAFLAVASAAGVFAWRRRAWTATFLLLWLVVTLAPSLGVIVRRSASALVADRYLYLPSVAVVLLVAWLLARLRPASSARWRAAVAVATVVAVLAAWQSVARSRVWADDVTFWEDVAAKTPDHALPHRELGTVYMRRGRMDDAERAFRRALEARADMEGRVMTWGNLGNLLFRRGELDAAEQAYRSGIELHRHHFLFNGLARVAMRRAEQAQARGDQPEVVRQVVLARDALNTALGIDPRDYRSHALLGQVLFSLGERDAARQHLEAALRIEPSGAVADTARQYLRRLGP